ncbi:hypothetical protein NOVO_07970 [Rickettsiales bacterium Ac37b]|nr:hypothetical protein NOVO_07970 [Rickettsiales bacterium Ac37b]
MIARFTNRLIKSFDALMILVILLLSVYIYLIIIYYDALFEYKAIKNHIGTAFKKIDQITLVNYAGGGLVQYSNRELQNQSAHDYGIDRIFTYSPQDLDHKFYMDNKFILEKKRGAGYWLWKPYIILDAMRRLPEGEIILYLDGDYHIKNDLSLLVELTKKYNRVLVYNGMSAEGKIKLHTSHAKNYHFVKRDAYVLMDCDREECYNALHLCASVVLLVNNQKNREFIQQWLKYSRDPRIVTEQPNVIFKEDVKKFLIHLHEQAILSLLYLRYTSEEQLVITKDDILYFLSHDENKRYWGSWLYQYDYHKEYGKKIAERIFDTKELNMLKNNKISHNLEKLG